MRLILLLTLAVWLLYAAPARASIVYERGLSKAAVWIANDDGSGAHRLVDGAVPHIAPNGATVAYVTGDAHAVLRAVPAAGGASRVLLKSWQYGPFAWSPDSRWIVAQAGPLNGAQRLVLVDLTSGAARTLAHGYFSGASFSPDSTQLVYARSSSQGPFAASNLSMVGVAAGSVPRALTSDGRSLFPIWGPTQIAYTHWVRPSGRHEREDAPKYNVWLIGPDGSGRRALTHDTAPFLMAGLVPVDWSADGTRLLTQFSGQDITYVVTVDPVSGREHKITSSSEGPVATALSADGSTILAGRGGGAFGGRSEVVSIPYAGGAATVLTLGQVPDWSR